ncbi:MAG TPA: hypothetical protein VGW75_10590 [Solirubrobacteraceae bacterium]|jgi:hypothetical protein|nr:hypothetical protein [Solirubrobacteraceae bacterium]
MAQIIDLAAERRVRRPTESTLAARVALRAHERGVGGAFELALTRLARRWDQPPDAIETLAEAASVAGLSLDEVVDAAYDPRRDGELRVRPAR